MFTTGGYASPIKYIFIYFNRKGGGAASFLTKTLSFFTPPPFTPLCLEGGSGDSEAHKLPLHSFSFASRQDKFGG